MIELYYEIFSNLNFDVRHYPAHGGWGPGNGTKMLLSILTTLSPVAIISAPSYAKVRKIGNYRQSAC